jgi:predicted  nucleic acid-binding Zn-ribbon protein
VFGVLAWLLVRMSAQAQNDRRDYAVRLQEERAQNTKDLADAVAAGNARADDLREQIRQRDADLDNVRAQIETERRARFAAEDEAAHWRRLAGGRDDAPAR